MTSVYALIINVISTQCLEIGGKVENGVSKLSIVFVFVYRRCVMCNSYLVNIMKHKIKYTTYLNIKQTKTIKKLCQFFT